MKKNQKAGFFCARLARNHTSEGKGKEKKKKKKNEKKRKKSNGCTLIFYIGSLGEFLA